MKLVRVVRLVELIGMLQSGRGHNVQTLADECRVSRRTIFRDLDILRQAGVPLVFDESDQRYRIAQSFVIPPTNLTAEEALSLLVLSQELGNKTGLPFQGPARNAALKLESSLPPRLRNYLREVSNRVHIRIEAHNGLDGHEETYRGVLAAMLERKCLRIAYDSLTEWAEISTRLSPYHMLFTQRSWFVVGRSSLHRSVRTFNLGRIKHLEMLDESFELPRRFSIDRYLRNAWRLIPGTGKDSQIVVRFRKQVARNVAEVNWHKTQRVENNADGSIDFHVTVSGLDEISWWILGYGDHAEVLAPPELRQLIQDRCRRMLANYETSTTELRGIVTG